MTLTDRITRPGPKRLLALDGGGIRGLISLEILAEIERQLRDRVGAGPAFVLADYFDYIGGTSTGGIIAALLSFGLPVAEVRAFYVRHGRDMFARAIAPWQMLRSKYRDTRLAATLHEIFGDAELGSDRLRTLLLLVMRNANTDSPWPVSNNPFAKYNQPDRPDCNLKLPLWTLVRASAAAPFYFPPQTVPVGERAFRFVDGGMTSYNNPAFLLFLMATLVPYRLRWPVGEDQLLLVSVGTGTNPRSRPVEPWWTRHRLAALFSVLMDPRFAALVEQDFLCRVFGRCRAGDPIDNEVGDLRHLPNALGGLGGSPVLRMFVYVRYNIELSRPGLDAAGLGDINPRHVARLDSAHYMDQLQRVGRTVAERQVCLEHFEGFLTPPGSPEPGRG